VTRGAIGLSCWMFCVQYHLHSAFPLWRNPPCRVFEVRGVLRLRNGGHVHLHFCACWRASLRRTHTSTAPSILLYWVLDCFPYGEGGFLLSLSRVSFYVEAFTASDRMGVRLSSIGYAIFRRDSVVLFAPFYFYVKAFH